LFQQYGLLEGPQQRCSRFPSPTTATETTFGQKTRTTDQLLADLRETINRLDGTGAETSAAREYVLQLAMRDT
jgi:hypothetical protein